MAIWPRELSCVSVRRSRRNHSLQFRAKVVLAALEHDGQRVHPAAMAQRQIRGGLPTRPRDRHTPDDVYHQDQQLPQAA